MLTLSTALLLLVALAYAALAAWVLLHRSAAGSAWRLLLLYAGLGAIWSGLAVAVGASDLGRRWPDVQAQLPLYAVFSLSLVLVYLTREFLRMRPVRLRWYGLGLLVLAVVMVIDSGALRLPVIVAAWPGWYVGRLALMQAALVVGWALSVANAVLVTGQVYRRTHQPLHRNRQAYWSIALSVTVIAAAVILVGQAVIGQLIFLSAGVLMTLGLLTHDLPDVRQALRQALGLLSSVGLAVAIYAAVILVAPLLPPLVPGLSGPLAAVLLAVVIVALANPALSRLQRRLDRWTSGARYDPQQMVGEYGLTISGILELDRLADVALGLIRTALGIDRAVLFVVEPPAAESDAAQFYGLRPVGVLGAGAPAGALLLDSPIVAHFRQEFAAVTQYELDLRPQFRTMAVSERLWLQSMNMDVFVPVYASRQWIGLFALGPKTSRNRYFEADLRLLSTLADQTAVALQNARLVDDLVRLNARIKDANTALDDANQRLAHLDRVKSDFITVISHELRTPLSILYGYTQILLTDAENDEDDYHRQLVEGINTGTTRMQEIIENMLDVTKIDSRALVLSAQPVSIETIVSQVLASLRRPILERQLAVESTSLSGLPPVEADAAALSKVFHHLVVNAVKFTPDGGQITVSGRCLDDALPGGALEIAIRDTGIGIDPRFLDLIFTKFYQMGEVALHSSGKTKFKGGGPGLGLAIARGIVEAHGGRLRAESTGHDESRLPGSRFVILLPLAQSKRLSKQPLN